jgi:hypothetical protein
VLYAAAGANPLEPAEERGQARPKAASPPLANAAPVVTAAAAVPTSSTDSPSGIVGGNGSNRGSPAGGTGTGSGSGSGGQTDYGFWPTMERIVRQPPLALSPDDGYSPELCDFIAVWYHFFLPECIIIIEMSMMSLLHDWYYSLVKDPIRRATTTQLLVSPSYTLFEILSSHSLCHVMPSR